MKLLMIIALVGALSMNCFAGDPPGGGYDGNGGTKRSAVSGAEGNRSGGETVRAGVDHN